jgi:hypothetical protein
MVAEVADIRDARIDQLTAKIDQLESFIALQLTINNKLTAAIGQAVQRIADLETDEEKTSSIILPGRYQ